MIYTDKLACKGNSNSASRFGNTFSELTRMRSDDIYILTSLLARGTAIPHQDLGTQDFSEAVEL